MRDTTDWYFGQVAQNINILIIMAYLRVVLDCVFYIFIYYSLSNTTRMSHLKKMKKNDVDKLRFMSDPVHFTIHI